MNAASQRAMELGLDEVSARLRGDSPRMCSNDDGRGEFGTAVAVYVYTGPLNELVLWFCDECVDQAEADQLASSLRGEQDSATCRFNNTTPGPVNPTHHRVHAV